jgi:hypothetical protein
VGEAIGDRILALVVPYAGDVGETFGSAGRVGRGLYVTALHCVRECLVKERGLLPEEKVPADATCGIVPVVDVRRTPNLDDLRPRLATLLWPPAGTPFHATDMAVLRVEDTEGEDDLGYVRTTLVRHAGLHRVDVVAYGYPTFLKGKGGSPTVAECFIPHMALGPLSTSDGGTGYHEFTVTGEGAEKIPEWKGMSGAIVMKEETTADQPMCILGVVARHPAGGQGRTLRVLPIDSLGSLDKSLAGGFFKQARLSEPLHETNARQLSLEEFKLLIDRSDEIDLLLGNPEQPMPKPPHRSLVMAYSFVPDDRDALFATRLGVEMQWRFGGAQASLAAASRSRGGPYASPLTIDINVGATHNVRHLLCAFYQAASSKIGNVPKPPPAMLGQQPTPIGRYEDVRGKLVQALPRQDKIGLLILRLRRGSPAVSLNDETAKAVREFLQHIVALAAAIEPRALPVAFAVTLAVGEGAEGTPFVCWTHDDREAFEAIVNDVFWDDSARDVARDVIQLKECSADHVIRWYNDIHGLLRSDGHIDLPGGGGIDIVKLARAIAAQRKQQAVEEWRMVIITDAIDGYDPRRGP